MDTTLDEILALLGAKEVQIYALGKRVDELEMAARAEPDTQPGVNDTNHDEDTDKE